ncbi:MAG: rhodanese [Verrucomicrobiales bacterium]|nr:rhodanese [Verrucomicrobiales bacterium]
MKLRSINPLLSVFAICIGLVACNETETATEESAPEETQASLEVVDVDAAAADKLLKDDSEVVVVDVRTPEEFKEGHLKDAVNIDFKNENFESELEKLDPDKTYLVHCRSGSRSGQSLAVFEKLNFTKLYHLTPGYNGWVDAGNEVVK